MWTGACIITVYHDCGRHYARHIAIIMEQFLIEHNNYMTGCDTARLYMSKEQIY
jgi:hypothetical protein